jgi:O-antigen biosynthesis protein
MRPPLDIRFECYRCDVKRPDSRYLAGRGLLLGVSYAISLLCSPSRLRSAFRKAVVLLRTVGPSGVWHTFHAKLHWRGTPYPAWVKIFDTLQSTDAAAIAKRIEALPRRPLISVLVPVRAAHGPGLRRAIHSVLHQLYPDWELCIADDGSLTSDVGAPLADYPSRESRVRIVRPPANGSFAGACNAALESVRGEYVALLDANGELPRHALYVVAEELNAHPATDILYTDEDTIDEEGRRSHPFFKPDWNPDLFTSHDYLSGLTALRTDLVRGAGGFREGFEGSEEYDLRLRCVARAAPERIRHSSHVLQHRCSTSVATRAGAGKERGPGEAARRALQEFVSRDEPLAKVEAGPVPGTFRVRRPLPASPPLVTLVVPTRDQCALLRQCVESIRRKTTYPSYELLVVDNQSRAPETLAYFEELRASGQARVLSYDRAFNYSAINNFAVAQARGELIGLLNNDVEVISPDWLSEMVAHALRPQVGAVGAKLYYPDGSIQHAGVIVGLGGVADHGHRYLPGTAPGYFSRVQLVHDLSAVTGACLVIRRELYLRLGGLDAENLPVAFNDVDFCLRLRQAGYLNVWTPYAELLHHESVSRGTENTPEKRARAAREIEFMKSRWGARLLRDPYYSPNLTLNSENFALAWPPRVPKPWRTDLRTDAHR